MNLFDPDTALGQLFASEQVRCCLNYTHQQPSLGAIEKNFLGITVFNAFGNQCTNLFNMFCPLAIAREFRVSQCLIAKQV